MRILHVVERLNDRGGASWHVKAVTDALVSTGHEVLVAAGETGGLDLRAPVEIVSGLGPKDRGGLHLEGLLAAFEPDVVHLQNVLSPATLASSKGLPAVITAQDHRYFCPGRGKWTLRGEVCSETLSVAACAGCFEDLGYFERVYRLTRDRLAGLEGFEVIVLSAYMAGELQRAGVPPERLHVIPPFVHGLPPPLRAAEPTAVAFVGRLARAKGVYDAVEAWRLSEVDLPLVFAGTGPERGNLERQGFEVLGWLDREALAALYLRSAAVLVPSRWQEPFGIVGIEARSLGVPVVTWRSGGISEWAGDDLPDWGDVPGLARALTRAVAGGLGRPFDPNDPVDLMECLVSVYTRAVSTAQTAALR